MTTPVTDRLNLDAESPAVRAARNSEYHQDEFLMLGFDHGSYYYLSKGSGQVITLKSSQHVEANLIELAPKTFWEHSYGGDKGVDWKAAHNALIRRQHAIGIYNANRVRGRGGWWDRTQAALHLGDRIIVNGEERTMASSKEFIYEAASPIRINYKNPLSAKEANAFSKICEMISWDRPINARYLAGWCAIAPICGALEWRPHIWITGAAGSGKSFVLDKIVRRIIGDIGLSVQSATTEAGLRQTLRHDARPVMFDEIEGADQRAQARIQNILELARQASSETGASLIKGTVTGEAQDFRIRSCFAFSSIGVSATSRPDETRITVLGINVDGDQARFARLAIAIGDTMTDDYVQRFMARSVRMIPVIRQNARIFATAAAAVLGSQRAGDQVGALFAGAYSLHSDDVVTAKFAQGWIAKQDWSDHARQNEDTDESKCLAFLLQQIVKSPSKSGIQDRSIAELMDAAAERAAVTPDEQKTSAQTLGLHGMRGDPDGMVISVSHSAIAKMLRDTEWAKTWARTLLRIPGANRTMQAVRFGSIRTRGVEIPWPDDDRGSDPV